MVFVKKKRKNENLKRTFPVGLIELLCCWNGDSQLNWPTNGVLDAFVEKLWEGKRFFFLSSCFGARDRPRVVSCDHRGTSLYLQCRLRDTKNMINGEITNT